MGDITGILSMFVVMTAFIDLRKDVSCGEKARSTMDQKT